MGERFFKYVAIGISMFALSSGIVVAQSWVHKLGGSGLGNPLTYNPVNTDILYGSNFGAQVYVSRNRGYSWAAFGNVIPGGGVIKSISVNPLDTLQILCGVEGGALDRIMKTTNGGSTWSQKWAGEFSYFGKPVEFKPIHPDTVYTMGNDTVYRSIDFGSTWNVVSVVTGFNAWCDAEIRPDSANIIYIGDFSSGIWKTTDYGVNWKKVYTTAGDGEIPSIAIDPFNPRVAYATKYSGGGGVLRTTNWGESWSCISTPIKVTCTDPFGGNGWWITCSKTTPGYVYFGTYGANPSGIFLSRDSGATWTNMNASLSSPINYGLMVLDTLTVIALQDDGIYKLQYPTAIHISSPNGGEYWNESSVHNITWTAEGIYYVKLEFSANGGSSWTTIADSVPAGQPFYSWTVPFQLSDSCRIRISDALFTTTADTSDSNFVIYHTPIHLVSPNGSEEWDVGSLHTISWTVAPVLPTVDIYSSTDSGATWDFIATRAASADSLSWTVPNSPSSQCLIRISDKNDSTATDVSDSVFTISVQNTFSAYLHIRDQGMIQDSMKFGTLAGATDGIDTSLGEAELPPKPSPGTYDIRWRIPATNGTKKDFRDTLGGANDQHLFVGEFQPGAGGYPCLLTWNPDSLKTQYFILRDAETHGSIYNLEMRRHDTLTVADSVVHAVEILECRPITIEFSAPDGWNLISIPVLVGDSRKTSILPYYLSNCFRYQAGYILTDDLTHGDGFWVKTGQLSFTGCRLTVDTVSVAAGWNLIGSLSTAIPTSTVTSIPDSLVASMYFGFGSTGYTPTTTLYPGYGYWVKMRGAGKLVLTTSPSAMAKQVQNNDGVKDLHFITVADGAGHAQALYFGEGDPQRYGELNEMPPAPPVGAVEAQFAPRGLLRVHSKTVERMLEYPLLISSPSDKLFFSWQVENEENFTYILVERIGTQSIAETRLINVGSIVVHNNTQSTFTIKVQHSVESAEAPQEYSLGQVYPNPFNPTTHFRFSVPFSAHVLIRVYNVLGEEISTLVDELYARGAYNVECEDDRPFAL
ncbi:MAG: hypothetical protein HY277_04315 [Ignavibacteriales bacterium]|nr:hypothetical protein [Ignavibacteriales bacterium]